MLFENHPDLKDVRDASLLRTEVEIVRARESVALSVIALRRELARTVDWREWVRRKPGVALAVAFGVGFLMAGRT